LIGSILTASIATALADSHAAKAYLVVGGSVIDATGLEAYGAKAGPVAQKAGIKVLGRSESVLAEHVLEGAWPHEGFLAVEEFNSMEALLGFWHSDDYQEAIKLREGKVKLDFVVAVPGMEAPQ
jgi:uncharacterized protein (DUF1330 family)